MSRRAGVPGLVGMTRTRTTYWITTAIIALVMTFSFYKMYTPLWAHLGYPTYLRTELSVAKIVGLIALVVPGVPLRIKEWAYVGFAIVLVSAAVAHLGAGDPTANVVEPLGFLVILLLSYRALHRLAR